MDLTEIKNNIVLADTLYSKDTPIDKSRAMNIYATQLCRLMLLLVRRDDTNPEDTVMSDIYEKYVSKMTTSITAQDIDICDACIREDSDRIPSVAQGVYAMNVAAHRAYREVCNFFMIKDEIPTFDNITDACKSLKVDSSLSITAPKDAAIVKDFLEFYCNVGFNQVMAQRMFPDIPFYEPVIKDTNYGKFVITYFSENMKSMNVKLVFTRIF